MTGLPFSLHLEWRHDHQRLHVFDCSFPVQNVKVRGEKSDVPKALQRRPKSVGVEVIREEDANI